MQKKNEAELKNKLDSNIQKSRFNSIFQNKITKEEIAALIGFFIGLLTALYR